MYAQERKEDNLVDPSNEQHIRSDAIKRRNVAIEAYNELTQQLDPISKRKLRTALGHQLGTAFLFDQGVSWQRVFFQAILKK